MHKAEFIAHRGSSYLAPENTLAALRLGWKETRTCELDVRATADGEVLVVHDETALRTTGIDLVVARHSRAELQSLDAGAWKGAEWRGEIMPTLAEVLAAMPEGKRLLVEVKGGPAIVPELARVIEASGRAADVGVMAFDVATCAQAKAALPGVPVYLLAWLGRSRREAAKAWPKALATTRERGLDGLGINNAPVLNERVLAELHEAKLRLNVWTVDHAAAAKRLARLGVDGIITNRPGWLKSHVEARRRSPARKGRVVLPRRRP
ncbi:MAG TPA: glycerophosphodiester phosphodiesterase family protein [Candidatus Methylacidiphilales bacterium]|nr:glycerophosphodiester phosphodiesterase family protein [Candidatus Methylacidiphilales bacterium]